MSPLSLSSVGIEEKNKLATNSVWLLALEITVPGLTDPLRIVRNNENVTWRGETWSAFPFEIDEIGEESKGEVPQVEVRVSNVSRAMEAYIQAYDLYTKVNGFTPITVSIFVLNSKNLASSDPEVEHLFELKQPKTNAQWATFVLGASNPFNQRYPQARILRNHCRFIFKGALCAYAGAEATCDKTLVRCREIFNYHVSWVTGVTLGNPTIISIDASLSINKSVHLDGILGVRDGDGASPFNRKDFNIGPAYTNSLSIPIDTTGYTDYVSGGQASISNRFGGFPGVSMGGLRLNK